METSGTDQLEYYLSSLSELGEILIDADRTESVGSGVLRLTLGTVMASKGAIFFYNKNEKLTTLSKKGVRSLTPLKPTKKIREKFFKNGHGHIIINEKEKWLTGKLKTYLLGEKITTMGNLSYRLIFYHIVRLQNMKMRV